MENELLQELGLTQNESKVYLALLALKGAKITAIANKADLHPKNAYNALETLIKKGLASYSLEGNVHIFKAESPMKLREILAERANKLDKILPELFTAFRSEEQIREISILKGKEGLNMLLDGLTEGAKQNPEQGVVVYAPHELEFMVQPDAMIKFRKLYANLRRIRSHMRLIHIDTKRARKNARLLDRGFEKTVIRRYVPNLTRTSVGWSSAADTVFINFFVKEDMLYIRIKSKDVATAFRESFELLWKIAGK